MEVITWATHRGCAFHWGQAVWRKIAPFQSGKLAAFTKCC